MENCIFCKIANGEIPSKTVYEDEIVRVFLDINPHANGHMLVVPKKHFTDFTELDDETLLHINNVVKKMKDHLNETLKPEGIMFGVNYGICQEVKHYHLHIIPQYADNRPLDDVDKVYEELSK